MPLIQLLKLLENSAGRQRSDVSLFFKRSLFPCLHYNVTYHVLKWVSLVGGVSGKEEEKLVGVDYFRQSTQKSH